MTIILKITGHKCKRCSHTWVPRRKEKLPKVCPKCKSAWWDEDRKLVS